MTQPAVIFSNYDGAHTADRAANNTIPALPKWKGRQSGRKKEAAEVCCLSLLFWVKICDAQQQTATATATANIASNQNLNTELTKNKPKKKRHFFIYFNYFQVFFGIFRFTHCKVLQTRPEPVRASRLFTGKTEDISRRNLAKYRKLNLNLAKQISPWPKTTRRKNPKLSAHMLLWMKPEKK